jgi:hypothetical protein
MIAEFELALLGIVGTALATFLGAAARYLLAHLPANLRKGLWGEAVQAVEAALLKYEQTAVGDLKAKAAVGALNPEALRQELAKVKGLAVADSRGLLGPATLAKIMGAYGLTEAGLSGWLGDLLEARLGERRAAAGVALPLLAEPPKGPSVPPAGTGGVEGKAGDAAVGSAGAAQSPR